MNKDPGENMDKIKPSNSTRKEESPDQKELENLLSSEQNKPTTRPRSSAQRPGRSKKKERRKFSISKEIILALITLLSAICVATIYNFDKVLQLFPSPTPTLTSTLTSTFTPTVTLAVTLAPANTVPTISISNDIRDTNGNPIAVDSAPFQISINGTVSNADGLYVYLIVANPYDHYVQPGLGLNVDGEFSGFSYLGVQGVPDGLQYTIYAVVTDKPYADQASFKDESYITKSKELKLTRESLPTPIVTP